MNLRTLATVIIVSFPALTFAGSATIRGTVYRENGAPAPNVPVFLEREGSEVGDTNADAAGEYELTGVAAGEAYVVSTGGSCLAFYASAPFVVIDGKNLVVDLGPKPAPPGEGCRLRARVQLDLENKWTPFASILLLSKDPACGLCYRMVPTDSKGQFEIADLPPGAYSCVVIGSRRFVARIVVPKQREYTCDLVPATGSITGVVRDARTRDPIKGVLVVAWPGDAPGNGMTATLEARGRSSKTDEAGRYTIIGLSRGPFFVEVGQTNWTPNESEPSFARELTPCAVVDEKPTTCDVALASAVSLSVSVRAAAGGSVPNAVARVDDWSNASPLNLSSNDPGSLTINGLKPGEHVVTVSHPEFAVVRRRVRVGEKGGREEFVLTVGGSLNVTVVDRAGKTIDGASIEIVDKSGARVPTERGIWDMFVPPQTVTMAGRFRVAHIAAGDYSVRATKAGAASGSAVVTVGEGGEATVRLALQ